MEAAARRETLEETGVTAPEKLTALGFCDWPSRKRVFAFAGVAVPDTTPRLASWEIDRAEFVPLEQARMLLHPALREFITRLEQMLKGQ